MSFWKKVKEWKLKYRQNIVIRNLRTAILNRKIRVVFLNCEASKWAYQYIYERFSKDDRFDVKVLVSVYDLLLNKKYDYLNYPQKLKENYEFFKKQGFNVEYAFDFKTNKPIDLKYFAPDIIFYDEPQSVPEIQSTKYTSKYALSYFCSYGSCISNGRNEYSEIYKELCTYFIDNLFTRDFLLEHGFDNKKLCVAGQPKTECYLKPIDYNNIYWKTNKKHIIYAPHFSFDKNTELKYGTFNWNNKYFYEYAKNHPEYEFILKPHPSLKREIVKRKLMSVAEMTEYFEEWDKLPNAQVVEAGNYIDMFKTSDLLITDCNSFLYEYLPSEKPVIHLISQYSIGHNSYGEKITEGYYKAKTLNDIEGYLNLILENNNDPMLEKRKEIIQKDLIIPKNGVSNVVFNCIEKTLYEGVV